MTIRIDTAGADFRILIRLGAIRRALAVALRWPRRRRHGRAAAAKVRA